MEKTLAKGLFLLEALVRKDQPSGVSDVAASLGISKSNAHRLLNTLVATGYVTSADGRYAANLKLWELGTRLIGRYNVRELARPAMTRLVRDTAEAVRLTVLDVERLEVVYIDKIDSPQDVRIFTDIGGRAPAQCTSSGKIMLAYQDDSVIMRAAGTLKSYSDWSIIDPERFIRHLRTVRANGYAMNQREFSAQVRGIAAPIFDGEGRIVAALSIAAPAERLPSARLRQLANIICEAAAGVTARMRPAGASPVPLATRISSLGQIGSNAVASVRRPAARKMHGKTSNPREALS